MRLLQKFWNLGSSSVHLHPVTFQTADASQPHLPKCSITSGVKAGGAPPTSFSFLYLSSLKPSVHAAAAPSSVVALAMMSRFQRWVKVMSSSTFESEPPSKIRMSDLSLELMSLFSGSFVCWICNLQRQSDQTERMELWDQTGPPPNLQVKRW